MVAVTSRAGRARGPGDARAAELAGCGLCAAGLGRTDVVALFAPVYMAPGPGRDAKAGSFLSIGPSDGQREPVLSADYGLVVMRPDVAAFDGGTVAFSGAVPRQWMR